MCAIAGTVDLAGATFDPALLKSMMDATNYRGPDNEGYVLIDQASSCYQAYAWREIITPYNCRDVLTTFLSVDERHRRAPDYALFRQLIERLWPDVLQEPINPRPRQSLLQRLKGAVRSLPRYWS
jgi:hypothetical protein